MMNKLLAKKSLFVMAIVTGAILILSLALNLILGVNYAMSAEDYKTVTVQVDDYYFKDKLDDVKDVCETTLETIGEEYNYCYKADMSADGELVFVFDNSVDHLAVETALEEAFNGNNGATVVAGALNGAEVFVTARVEKVVVSIPSSYAWNATFAVLAFTALTFVYVALRYRLNMGVIAAASTLGGAVLTTAIILLVRIPVTTSIFGVGFVGAMLSAVFTLLTFNKLRANLKTEAFEEKNAEETMAESVAVNESLALAAVLGVAFVLVGAIARINVLYFALTAIIALVTALFVGGVLASAVFVPLLAKAKKADAEKNKSGYIGAKKEAEETVEETQEN